MTTWPGHSSTLLEKGMSRRFVLRALGLTGATMAILPGVHLAAQDSSRHTSQPYTVTTNANLRSGPGTSHSVLTIIPKGATFTLTAEEQNNFHSVTYQGTNGWVYAPLIVPAGEGSSPDPTIVGEARASTAVNLRSGPGTSSKVFRVVPSGAAVQVSNTTRNGFRYVVHDGLAGWIADQYLVWGTHQPPGATLTTTANLNLRAEPSISASVLLVMPEGATVAVLGVWSNGFRKVSYKGMTGWAHASYLS